MDKNTNIQSDESLLKYLCDEFESNNIEYWIDSGTLLGIIRNGELLKREADGDLDFGIFESDKNKLLKRIGLFDEFEFSIQTKMYDGKLFEIKIIPDNDLRHIGINIFREGYDKDGNCYFWCPVPYVKNPFSDILPLNVTFEYVRLLLKYINKTKSGKIIIDKGLVARVAEIGTWWIPFKFYSEFTTTPKYNARIPSDYQAYLEYRYGDWKESSDSWDYWYDDGGIIQEEPKELIESY